MKGFFITFEGIEGTGKSTHIKNLAAFLLNLNPNRPVLITREPGGTPISDKIRALLLDQSNHHLVPRAELFLYMAARAQHVEEVIKPALKKGTLILCDRYSDATTAYQGYGRGFPIELIHQLNQISSDAIAPHLTLLFDGTPAICVARSKNRLALEGKGESEGRFEAEALSFHEQVRQGYLDIAKKNPERVKIINAEDDLATVFENIKKIVLDFLR